MIAWPKPLRVLPCFDSRAWTPFIAALRSTVGVDLLSFAPASTLVYRALSDEPDAIVIATEDFGTVASQNDIDLIEALSSTPTVLLCGRIHALLKKQTATFHIRSILPLQATPDQLLAAIQATVTGLTVTLEPFGQTEDPYTASSKADGIGLAGRFAEHLTARETVVLRLMALGLGNKEIASRLDISEHTAKFHVSSILAKLGAASRTEAVTIGMTRGLVAI
ncbi:MAG TPA: response regulator transcription factor [Edaphobacter sp.]|nr:response regulator transcription factor [Edaphobacter sp.]